MLQQSSRQRSSYFVIRSSMLRGSRMNVGRTTRLRSAPGRSCEMICMSTVEIGQSVQMRRENRRCSYHCPARARLRACHRRQSRPCCRLRTIYGSGNERLLQNVRVMVSQVCTRSQQQQHLYFLVELERAKECPRQREEETACALQTTRVVVSPY